MESRRARLTHGPTFLTSPGIGIAAPMKFSAMGLMLEAGSTDFYSDHQICTPNAVAETLELTLFDRP